MKRAFLFSPLMFLIAASVPANVTAQSAPAQSWTNQDLVGVEDGQFRCPETYSTDAEKTREMERFLAWTRSRYPNWTVEQIVAFRMATLKHHACTKTLNNIREAAD
jgi:hypothetical protein